MVKTTKTLKKDIPRHSGYQDAKETGICPHEPTFGEGRIMRISLHFFSTSDHYQLYPDLRQFKHSGFQSFTIWSEQQSVQIPHTPMSHCFICFNTMYTLSLEGQNAYLCFECGTGFHSTI